ncbi:MAG TPA: hypothetical protein VK711_02975 [Puia sp.]|nr:hypothetical protein [Puia sp.]
MKWVKFKQEFDLPGSFNELAKVEGLQALPKTTINAGDPNIYVSNDQNSIIDKCFRIYKDPASFYKVWDKETPSKENNSHFHPWVYHGKLYNKLPDRYFDDEYFETKKLKNALNGKESPVKMEFGKNHPYEIFVGGWIHFYDEEVRHGETDHAIYFDWKREERSVTIYILQAKPISRWNVYVKVNPPGSQDPPPPKSPPPSC